MAGYAEQVQALIEPTLEALGYELVGVQHRTGSRRALLRIYIDREQGVTVIAVSDSLASPIAPGAAHVFCVPTASAQFFTSTVALTALFETLMAFVIADPPDEVVASIERFHRRRHELGVYWDEEG